MAVDTSVVVAAFATWHEAHREAVAVVASKPDLPAPCALEAYAVLTRLPPPHRAEGAIVRDFIERAFPAPPLRLPDEAWSQVIERLVETGITGGASYDAVIGMITAHHERRLVTLDRRAVLTYDRVGASVQILG